MWRVEEGLEGGEIVWYEFGSTRKKDAKNKYFIKIFISICIWKTFSTRILMTVITFSLYYPKFLSFCAYYLIRGRFFKKRKKGNIFFTVNYNDNNAERQTDREALTQEMYAREENI